MIFYHEQHEITRKFLTGEIRNQGWSRMESGTSGALLTFSNLQSKVLSVYPYGCVSCVGSKYPANSGTW